MPYVTRSRGGAAVIGAGLTRADSRGTGSGNFHVVEDELSVDSPADGLQRYFRNDLKMVPSRVQVASQ